MTNGSRVERASLKIFIVACEESGDRLGGALMRSLAALANRPIEFSGVGGRDMEHQGLHSLFPIGELAIIGFNGVLAKLPMILRRIRETAQAVLSQRPDILVIIDSPDFTHRVARRVRVAAPSIPIVDYVSPSVWAWRPGRARAMRAYIDRVLALLPFEPQVHAQLGGPSCIYVGHPAAGSAASLRPNQRELARRQESPPVVLVLPGSRSAEIRRHLELFGAAVALLAKRCGPLELILPTVPNVLAQVRAGVGQWGVTPKVIVEPDAKAQAFRDARVALAASGTVTLELVIAGIPTVVAYRVSLLEELIGRLLLRGSSVVLPNLLLGENLIPEYLQRAATPQRLAASLAVLIADSAERARQLAAAERLAEIMAIGKVSPSMRAAEEVLAAIPKS